MFLSKCDKSKRVFQSKQFFNYWDGSFTWEGGGDVNALFKCSVILLLPQGYTDLFSKEKRLKIMKTIKFKRIILEVLINLVNALVVKNTQTLSLWNVSLVNFHDGERNVKPEPVNTRCTKGLNQLNKYNKSVLCIQQTLAKPGAALQTPQ